MAQRSVASSPWWWRRHPGGGGGGPPRPHRRDEAAEVVIGSCRDRVGGLCFAAEKYAGLQEEWLEPPPAVREDRLPPGPTATATAAAPVTAVTLVKRDSEGKPIIPLLQHLLPKTNPSASSSSVQGNGAAAQFTLTPLSTWILEVQTSVTKEYAEMLSSSVAQRLAAVGKAESHSAVRRKIKLLLAPPYTAPIKRLTDALTQYRTHVRCGGNEASLPQRQREDADATTNLSCAHSTSVLSSKFATTDLSSTTCDGPFAYVPLTVEALAATCGAFCAFSVCRWLVEGIIAMGQCDGEGRQAAPSALRVLVHRLTRRLGGEEGKAAVRIRAGEAENDRVHYGSHSALDRLPIDGVPFSRRRVDVESVIRWLQQCHLIARSLLMTWGTQWSFLMRYRPVTRGILPAMVAEIREWASSIIKAHDENAAEVEVTDARTRDGLLLEELHTALDHLTSLFS